MLNIDIFAMLIAILLTREIKNADADIFYSTRKQSVENVLIQPLLYQPWRV